MRGAILSGMDWILYVASRTAMLATIALTIAGCGGGEPDAPRDGEVVSAASTATPPSGSEPGQDGAAANPEAAPEPALGEAGVVVDVQGLVAQPGVYRMPPGSRVHEAIRAAGGARRGAQLAGINRAAVLVDGQQVVVAAAAAAGAGAGAAADGSSSAGGAPGTRVSINAADVTALDALPGIGAITAQKIIDDREQSGPYASVDDLDRVPGIGPATIESLRDVVTT